MNSVASVDLEPSKVIPEEFEAWMSTDDQIRFASGRERREDKNADRAVLFAHKQKLQKRKKLLTGSKSVDRHHNG